MESRRDPTAGMPTEHVFQRTADPCAPRCAAVLARLKIWLSTRARPRVRQFVSEKEGAGMPKIKEAASQFLANKRVALTGVSRQPKSHGSNVV